MWVLAGATLAVLIVVAALLTPRQGELATPANQPGNVVIVPPANTPGTPSGAPANSVPAIPPANAMAPPTGTTTPPATTAPGTTPAPPSTTTERERIIRERERERVIERERTPVIIRPAPDNTEEEEPAPRNAPAANPPAPRNAPPANGPDNTGSTPPANEPDAGSAPESQTPAANPPATRTPGNTPGTRTTPGNQPGTGAGTSRLEYRNTGLPETISYNGRVWRATGAPIAPMPNREYVSAGTLETGEKVLVPRGTQTPYQRIYLATADGEKYVAYRRTGERAPARACAPAHPPFDRASRAEPSTGGLPRATGATRRLSYSRGPVPPQLSGG